MSVGSRATILLVALAVSVPVLARAQAPGPGGGLAERVGALEIQVIALQNDLANLQAALAAEIAQRQLADAAEAATRANADVALLAAINAETAARQAADAALQPRSKAVSFVRLAAEGEGMQAVTGMGFQPTTVFVYCSGRLTPLEPTGAGSWGFAGSDTHSGNIHQWTTGLVNHDPVGINLIVKLTDGGPTGSSAHLVSFDPDGFALSWRLVGGTSGFDALCVALGMR